VSSAGSNPKPHLNPLAIEAMAEIGIDICEYKTCQLGDDQIENADVIISVGCGDGQCIKPSEGKLFLVWDLESKSFGNNIEGVRMIRDEITQKVQQLAVELELLKEQSAV